MKKIIVYLIAFTLLISINGCEKDKDFIPLYINNLAIDKIDGDKDLIVQSVYKDTQTLDCTIDALFLVKEDDLKITGVGAYYDGNKINMTIVTNSLSIDDLNGIEEIKLIPFRINFELTGNGLNKRKCYFFLTLNGNPIQFKIN